MTEKTEQEWWREAVVYQIYPRSFQDSNADGIGDLQGIIDRLDYLNDGTPESLGIDAIWLSPTFPSPMADFGYDVSNYCDVHPDFGTLGTIDRLIAECHKRRIKLLLDWVPNHTSDQHPWFLESKSSRDNPKRDWYIWRDPRDDGSLPNNWRAAFGGSVWTWDESTQQHYLHSFLKEQPDLNWRNPEVVEAMHDTLRFWLARGIDGFRIDVMGQIVKHPELADNPLNPEWTPERNRLVPKYLHVNSRNYPDVFAAVKGVRRVLDEYPGSMAVGEVFGSADEIAQFYGGADLSGLHLAFNFQLIHQSGPDFTRWEASTIRDIVLEAEAELPEGSQPCYAIGNHDRSRFISRNDHDGRGSERAAAAALVLLGLRNTPFVYYGEEIGMVDVDIPEDQLQDPARIRTVGRDPERTPMQWDASQGRGFSTAEPWLPFGPVDIHVESQRDDPDSLLSLYRRATWARKAVPALLRGSFRDLGSDADVFAFARETGDGDVVVVAVNTATEARRLTLPRQGDVLVATDRRMEGTRLEELELPALGAAWVALNYRSPDLWYLARMTERKRKRVPVGDDGRPVVVAEEPVTADEVAEDAAEECDCPRLDPDDWHQVESDWSDITFLKGSSSAVLGVPTGFQGTVGELESRATVLGATVPEDAMALLGSGQFRRPVWLEVEDAPDHKDIVRPGGVAYTRLVEAPLGTMGKLVREAEMEARVKYGRTPDSTWLWYLTCRVCSKERNFETLIVSHYRDAT